MEDAELLKMSGASAGTIAIVILVYKIGKSIVGKRFISNCCGKKMEIGIDIKEGTTPVSNPLVIRQPVEKNIDVIIDARTNHREQESQEGRSHSPPPSTT